MLLARIRDYLFRRSRKRHIFRFREGRRYRYVDPVTVSLLLAEHPEYLPRHLEEAREGDLEAIEICGRAAIDAFGVEPADPNSPSGMTLSDRVKLLIAFDLWIIGLKQKHDAFCRLAAIHGCNVSELDDEQFCALYFSRRESETRVAEIARLGNRSTTSELPLAWFIATRDTLDEAKFAYETHISAVASGRA